MNPVLECIAQTRAWLEKKPLGEEALHEARKALKKARAALRLLRPNMRDAAYRRQNRLLRDAGRALGPLRNVHSVRAALEDLGAAPLARRLRPEEEKARRALRLEACVSRLERAARARLPAAAPGEGLRRIYRKGRKASARAGKERSPEALHEWRKQVKYLLNALDILGVKGEALRRAGKLAERLGDDHDLALLSERDFLDGKMRKRIARRRSKLQEKAFALGKKLYSKKPGRFARELAP